MARPGLLVHPKFRRLVHILQLPVPYCLGLLECLWATAYENGDERIGDAVDVELAAQWPGKKGALAAALLDCRLIDDVGGHLHVHDLFDHAPHYVQARAEREAKRRIEGKSISDLRREAAHKRWCTAGANGMQTDATENHVHTGGMQTVRLPHPHPHPIKTLPPKAATALKKRGKVLPKPRDPIFDAIVEVTDADPKMNGAHIGKVAAKLKNAVPPYTPEEIRKLPATLQKQTWWKTGQIVTVGCVDKHIYLVRLRNRASPSGGCDAMKRIDEIEKDAVKGPGRAAKKE
jgi:hypothetical protein